MPCYDFRCVKCETIQETYYSLEAFHRTKVLKCGHCHCRTKHQVVPGMRNGYRQDNPGLYGKYYQSFGCVVRDAVHLRQLCKKFDVHMAGDPVGGAPSYLADMDRLEAEKRRPPPDTSGVLWGDADTERELRRLSPQEIQRRLHDSGVHQRV